MELKGLHVQIDNQNKQIHSLKSREVNTAQLINNTEDKIRNQ